MAASLTDMTETNVTANSNSLEPFAGPGAASDCAVPHQHIVRDDEALLRAAGLRPTRQRVALAQLLFSQGNRHVTADMLHSEAARSNLKVSLATIYNTLNQFAKVGLLREIGIDGSTTYFDTETSDHYHFFVEGVGELRDIPSREIRIGRVMSIPDGYEISRVDLVVRLRKC
jgi:Fur family transcriptional regulator, iron response regulator